MNKVVAVASRQGTCAIIFVRCSPGQYVTTSQILIDKNIVSSGIVFQATLHCIPIGSSLDIDRFVVVYSVTWPLNGSEAGDELALIQTSLFLLRKSSCSYIC